MDSATMTNERANEIAALFLRAKKTPRGCWEWTAARTAAGYGVIRKGPRNQYAHRLAYELMNGPIADGLCVCHRCDNPPCINPKHLFLGTKEDNSRDMAAKGRSGGRPSKLTPDQVREIRALADGGMIHREIGVRYGMTRRGIGSIVLRKTWRRVI